MRTPSIIALAVATSARLAGSAYAQPSQYPVRPVPLPDSAEIALAATAAPPEVSAAATVYAVRNGEVRTIRRGTNGAACMVARDRHAGSLYPICFNAEGARTILVRELLQARLRSLGVAEDSVDRAVATAFDRGELRVPQGFAMAYMLSPRQVLFSSPRADGRRVGAWHPHLMFYMPGATPATFGLSAGGDGPLQFSAPGTPHTEVIVKVQRWSDGTPVVLPPR